MKRFVTLILAAILAISCFAFESFADDETTGDGFDFYSMTAHYEQPVVVSYVYVTSDAGIVKKDRDGNPVLDENGNEVILNKAWIFADPSDSYIVPAIAYANSDLSYTSLVMGYQVKALGKNKWEKKFYSVVAPDFNMDSSGIIINSGYGLAHIGDNTAIGIISAATLYGATEYYDDAGTPNPNFTLVDGYFLDQAIDEDGNNLRIDVNGFVIDKNNIWHARDGHRIEPFVEVGTDSEGKEILTWINLASRLDSKGKVVDYTTITNQSLIDSGVLQMPEKYAFTNTEPDPNVDYDEDGKTGTSKDKKAFNALLKDKTNWLKSCSITMYTIDYIDANGDGKKTAEDLVSDAEKGTVGYNDPALVITQDNILTRTVKGNLIYIQGSPAIGNPVTKVKISGLTVEIDALGDKAYDVADDPQQKNEIVITTGDILQNIELAQAYVAEHPDHIYTEGSIIGRAKCVTTKTEYVELDGYPFTMKSVDVELEEGAVIPANATLYFNFKVQTQQPAHDSKVVKKNDYSLLTINKGKVDLDRIPPKPVEKDEEDEKQPKCGPTLAGGIAVSAVLALAFVVLRKKED